MQAVIAKSTNASEKNEYMASKLNPEKAADITTADANDSENTNIANFKFTRPTSRKKSRSIELKPEVSALKEDVAPEAYKDADDFQFENQAEDNELYTDPHSPEDILVKWDEVDEDIPDINLEELFDEDELEFTTPSEPPLLVGFDIYTDFVELEYMVVKDPETGSSVAPEITVKPTEDNKSGNIFLNGKLVACVVGGQELSPNDVHLVNIAA